MLEFDKVAKFGGLFEQDVLTYNTSRYYCMLLCETPRLKIIADPPPTHTISNKSTARKGRAMLHHSQISRILFSCV